MTETLPFPIKNRPLFVFAGICALIALSANLLDVVLGFGDTEITTYGTKSATEWLEIFQASPFKGIYALGILNIVYMVSMLAVYLGMVVAHRKTHLLSSVFAMLLAFLAVGIYVSSSAAIPMLALSSKYAAATDRSAIIAAAEAVLARGEDFTPGSFIGLFLSGIAAFSISIIMLRGRVFTGMNAWAGIVGFSFLTFFTVIATFIHSWYIFAFYFFGGLGGVLALSWFGMTGLKFLRLRT